jgi:hypothetical protein
MSEDEASAYFAEWKSYFFWALGLAFVSESIVRTRQPVSRPKVSVKKFHRDAKALYIKYRATIEYLKAEREINLILLKAMNKIKIAEALTAHFDRPRAPGPKRWPVEMSKLLLRPLVHLEAKHFYLVEGFLKNELPAWQREEFGSPEFPLRIPALSFGTPRAANLRQDVLRNILSEGKPKLIKSFKGLEPLRAAIMEELALDKGPISRADLKRVAKTQKIVERKARRKN